MVKSFIDNNGNIRYYNVSTDTRKEEQEIYKNLMEGKFMQQASPSLALARAIDKNLKNPPRVLPTPSGIVSHGRFEEKLNRMRENLKRRGLY